MNPLRGDIISVSRLRMGTDGTGISTLVTFFGCPLNCKYCVNDFCHDDETPRALFTADELVSSLKKDEIYHIMSGGGVAFGGGEPLLAADFIHEVCAKLNPKVRKRMETSLNVPWEYVEKLSDVIDEWIIDVKDMNPVIYKKYTGKEIYPLIDNLSKMAKYLELSKLHIRIPLIPEYNSWEDVEKSVLTIVELVGVKPEVFEYYKL